MMILPIVSVGFVRAATDNPGIVEMWCMYGAVLVNSGILGNKKISK